MVKWRFISLLYLVGLITVLIFLPIINNLIEIGGCYEMEMNVEEKKTNDDFNTAIPSKNYDRPKTTREYGILKIWVTC